MLKSKAHRWTFCKCSSGGTSSITYVVSCPVCGTSFDVRWVLEIHDARSMEQELLRYIKDRVNPDCKTQKKMNIMEKIMDS